MAEQAEIKVAVLDVPKNSVVVFSVPDNAYYDAALAFANKVREESGWTDKGIVSLLLSPGVTIEALSPDQLKELGLYRLEEPSKTTMPIPEKVRRPQVAIASTVACPACGLPHENVRFEEFNDPKGVWNFKGVCPIKNVPILVQLEIDGVIKDGDIRLSGNVQ